MVKTSNNILQQKNFLLPFLSATIAMLAGTLIFIVPAPVVTQFHETKAEQYKTVVIIPDITIALDANTAITVTNSEPPKVELIQGNAYFDSKNLTLGTKILEVIMGDIHFWNMGANFSLQKFKKGGSISITRGQLEMNLGHQARQIGAGQRIDFDNKRVIEESSVVGLDIAPWKNIPSY